MWPRIVRQAPQHAADDLAVAGGEQVGQIVEVAQPAPGRGG
jgi:hypothetical protein